MAKKMKISTTLYNYFNEKNDKGKRSMGIKAFNAELKQLTDDEKLELAEMAAAEMGVELDT